MCGNYIWDFLKVGGITIIYFEQCKQNKAQNLTVLLHTIVVFHTFILICENMIWYVLVQAITIELLSYLATNAIYLIYYIIINLRLRRIALYIGVVFDSQTN